MWTVPFLWIDWLIVPLESLTAYSLINRKNCKLTHPAFICETFSPLWRTLSHISAQNCFSSVTFFGFWTSTVCFRFCIAFYAFEYCLAALPLLCFSLSSWMDSLTFSATQQNSWLLQLRQSNKGSDASNHYQNIHVSMHLSIRRCSRTLANHSGANARQVLVFSWFNLASLPWIPFFLRIESCTMTLAKA